MLKVDPLNCTTAVLAPLLDVGGCVTTKAPTRNRELAQIHIARQQFEMDDDAYRDVLRTVARVRSAVDLDWSQARARSPEGVRLQGEAEEDRAGNTVPLALTKEAIEAKIAVQLKELGQNWPYAYGVGKRIFPKVARFEFLTAEQLGDVSSASSTIRFRRKQARPRPDVLP